MLDLPGAWRLWSGRWTDPLRAEMRSRPLTFQASVTVKVGAVDPMDSPRGQYHLKFYGDTFEVVDPVPLFRLLNGVCYCYRAQDTTIEMVHGVLHEWIEICGVPGSGAVRIRIRRRKSNRLLWDELVRAGTRPVGEPPLPDLLLR